MFNPVSLLFKNKKEKATDEVEEKYSSVVKLTLDSNGNFLFDTQIDDLSDKNAEAFSLLIIQLFIGGLDEYFYNSIAEWVGDDNDKKIFWNKVATNIKKVKDQAEEDQDAVNDDVVVKANMVFNMERE